MGSDNVQNILGYNSNDNKYDSSSVVANADGSVIERQQYMQDLLNSNMAPVYGADNYLAVPITFSALTTGSVATHELFTVTGTVRVKILAVCSTNLAGSGTIELGVESDTDAFIATTTGTDLDAGELWYDATPTTVTDAYTTVVLDKVVVGEDIGYEIKTDTLTGGVVTFHLWYTPLDSTGAVVASDGLSALV